MADPKSVVIKLTNEQREAIKRATGQEVAELKVEALEGRITPMTLEQRKAPFEVARQEARKAPTAVPGADEMEARKAPFAAKDE